MEDDGVGDSRNRSQVSEDRLQVFGRSGRQFQPRHDRVVRQIDFRRALLGVFLVLGELGEELFFGPFANSRVLVLSEISADDSSAGAKLENMTT